MKYIFVFFRNVSNSFKKGEMQDTHEVKKVEEYFRPLGNSVKKARNKLGYLRKQVADLINADERTIMSIEVYKANTTTEVLYPVIRVLRIDAREIYNPEIERDSLVHHQLRTLLADCIEEEAATLVPVCQSVLTALWSRHGAAIQERTKKACLP